MAERIFAVIGGIVTVAMITALVGSNSNAPEVIGALGRAFAGSITAATGRS